MSNAPILWRIGQHSLSEDGAIYAYYQVDVGRVAETAILDWKEMTIERLAGQVQEVQWFADRRKAAY